MKLLIKHKNLIKTECGINKFNKLEKNKSFFGKLRFFIFYIIAVLRDYRK